MYNGSVGSLAALRPRIAAMPVAMELSRIIISEINDQQVIYLEGSRRPRGRFRS